MDTITAELRETAAWLRERAAAVEGRSNLRTEYGLLKQWLRDEAARFRGRAVLLESVLDQCAATEQPACCRATTLPLARFQDDDEQVDLRELGTPALG
jgi:hypothetical protein